MNRRKFLSTITTWGLSLGWYHALPLKAVFAEEEKHPTGTWTIDAHAHPYCFHRKVSDPGQHTLEMMLEAGVSASAFAAVGDYIFNWDPGASAYADTLRQLEKVHYWENQGRIRIMRSPWDLLFGCASGGAFYAILAVEGGDALEGRLDYLDAFYDMGVRIITLVHNDNNQIGNDMRQFGSDDSSDSGLTDFGYRVVERMNELGMLIDVAHASTKTLLDVAEVTKAPIIDSHTNPLPPFVETRSPGRLRTYAEMEAVVKTGGVVCTWPLAYGGPYPRQTFSDWVQEISLFKDRFGIRHMGLGTDGGGGLPDLVDGWNDISDLPLLKESMIHSGFNQREINAFMGFNLLRVLFLAHFIGRILTLNAANRPPDSAALAGCRS